MAGYYCGLPSVWSLSVHNKGIGSSLLGKNDGGAQLMPIRPFHRGLAWTTSKSREGRNRCSAVRQPLSYRYNQMERI